MGGPIAAVKPVHDLAFGAKAFPADVATMPRSAPRTSAAGNRHAERDQACEGNEGWNLCREDERTRHANALDWQYVLRAGVEASCGLCCEWDFCAAGPAVLSP